MDCMKDLLRSAFKQLTNEEQRIIYNALVAEYIKFARVLKDYPEYENFKEDMDTMSYLIDTLAENPYVLR